MIKPHIAAAWKQNDQVCVDSYAVVDTPVRRQCMQDWCKEMNAKYGVGTHWIYEFLAEEDE